MLNCPEWLAMPGLPGVTRDRGLIFRGPGPGREKVAKRSPPRTCQKNHFGLYHCQAQPRAVNSAVECHPHTVEVTGSNPVPPTSKFKGLRLMTVAPFPFRRPNGAQPLQKPHFPADRPPRVPVFHQVAWTLRVMAGVACPHWLWMYLMFFPHSINGLAYVSRRSWNLNRGKSAALRVCSRSLSASLKGLWSMYRRRTA